MPKKPLQSIRDRLPNVFERRTSSRPKDSPTPSSGPDIQASGSSLGLPKVFERRTSRPKDSPTPSSGPSDIQASGSTFGLLVDGVDPPQTLAREASDIAYKGLKGLLDVLDRVGYALPPLKAAATGLSSVLTVIDVCTSSGQVSVLD